MVKQLTFVIVASLGVCALAPAAASAAPRRVPTVSVNTDKAIAEGEATLRKASERASRAARKAGLKVNTSGSTRKASSSRDVRARNIAAASARREAVKKAIRKRLQGGNLATERR
jgi:hypothetical protein